MNKTRNTLLFMSLGAMIIFGILAIIKPRCHHIRLGENTDKKIDNVLKELGEVLDTISKFVHHTLNTRK